MTTTDSAPKAGNLPITLATWVFLLDDAGKKASAESVREACAALRDADEASVADKGQALVAAIEGGLGDARGFEQVLTYIGELYGADHIAHDSGDDRDDRLHQARAYQFRMNLPWLAAIIDRFPNGEVGEHWVMVEQVTDEVRCMDPYPWDDLDEEYVAPLTDFMVKWELAGARCLRWNP